MTKKTAKEKVTHALNQAKDSLKMLETLEREALAKARSYVKLPTAEEGRKLTNAKISAGLKKLGVVTKGELKTLEQRIEKLRDFVQVTNATEVFAKERPLFDASAARLEAAIAGADLRSWFASFFDPPEGAGPTGVSTARSSDVRVVVIPGLLAGGGNYGVGVRFPEARDGVVEEMTPVLGASRWDKDGLPTYGADTIPLLVHEIAHSYTNRIVDAHRDALLPLGERLYPLVAREMERQAYGTPTILVYESLVRAVVVRFIRERTGCASLAVGFETTNEDA
jgi:hypothetical protein